MHRTNQKCNNFIRIKLIMKFIKFFLKIFSVIIFIYLLSNRSLTFSQNENNHFLLIDNYKINDYKINNPYDFSKSKRILTQLHTHTDKSDGKDNTQQLINKYSDMGYQSLAITDHNIINWPWPNIPNNMIPIEGQEITQGYRNITESINDYYLRIANSGNWHITSLFNDFSTTNFNNPQIWINDINNKNGLSVIAHPHYTGQTLNDLKILVNYTGIEIFNKKVHLLSNKGYALDIWDGLLSSGRKNTWGFSVDDYHGDSNGLGYGKIIILSDNFNEESIKNNIKNSNFYSIVGNNNLFFENISVSGAILTVTTNIPSDIKFIGNNGVILKLVTAQSEVSYHIVGNENYIRV